MSVILPSNNYSQNAGLTNGIGAIHYDVRAPASSDVNFLVGQEWIWQNNGDWKLIGFSSAGGQLTANWVQIASSSGDVLSVTGTTNQVTSTPTTGAVVLSTPTTFIAPGSIASTTTITAGTGLTVTTGNLALSAAGSKINIHATTAASDSIGTSGALDGASPSQLVVPTTAVTAASKIFLSYATSGGTEGSLSVGTIVPGTSFQIKSSANGDTSTVNYWIIN